MNKVKTAVSRFLAKDGKNDTTVHETVNPAVRNEHITRKKPEEAQKVTDRDIRLERHSYNINDTKHLAMKHCNNDCIRQRSEAQRAQFKDTCEISKTQRSTSAAATISGKHVHYRKFMSEYIANFVNINKVARHPREHPADHPKADHPTGRCPHRYYRARSAPRQVQERTL